MVTAAQADPDKIASLREVLFAAFTDIANDKRWDRERCCIILSGGLDSSIAAQLGKKPLGLSAAFTILASPDCTDRAYAPGVAAAAGLQHCVVDVPLEDLLLELPTCIKVLKTFDPMTLRNDIAVCRALREAAHLGFTCAVTGDAADELFGGYNFTHRLEPEAWMVQRQKMVDLMEFGSKPLGRHFGVHVVSPFLHPAIVEAALSFNKAECVQEYEGTMLGKIPLRLACPEVLTCWRGKDPIEVGCGTTLLGARPWLPGSPPGYFENFYSPDEYKRQQAQAAAEGVQIRDPEHLYYYQAFRQVFPSGEIPGKLRHGSDPCPACHYQLSHPTQTFCTTCGHYDPQLRSKEQEQLRSKEEEQLRSKEQGQAAGVADGSGPTQA